MSIFQRNVVAKYLKSQTEDISERYKAYKAYFLDSEVQENIRSSKEEQFQEGFLRKLFAEILGYTVNPDPKFNLKTEFKNSTDSKKADGAIFLNGEPVGVIELKDHKTKDLRTVEAQAFGYKNNHKTARYVIISNFEKLRFYIDHTEEFEEFDLFNLSEEDFKRLYLILGYVNVEKGLPLTIKSESKSEEKGITENLYKDYATFKRELFEDILEKNSDAADKLTLFRKTQKLLDRLLFIFFAEDRGLIPPNVILRIIDETEALQEMGEEKSLYDHYKTYFKWLNEGRKSKSLEIFAYNGGLFKKDELLDSLKIDDKLLETHTRKLSSYDFESDVSVDILGHIFEHSLSEIEEIQNELNGVVTDKKASKRKKDGVFYTPAYITKYIVENTVGTLCENKKKELGVNLNEGEELREAEKSLRADVRKRRIEKLDAYREWLLGLAIVDPACGSGAFLNAAVLFLKEEHKAIDEAKASLFEKNDAIQLVLSDIETEILEKNIFGVDINDESVEIAKLSLWLHTAKPGRKLNNLNNNIKCGNSLISDPEVAGEKAFDWEKEFPEVFAKGGFDVVASNPPYVSAIELKKSYTEDEYDFLKKNYQTAKGTVDLYIYFFEKGLNLLKPNGLLSYITPNRFLSASYGSALRQYILQNYFFSQVLDFSDKDVFPDASTYPVISIISKSIVGEEILCGKVNDDKSLSFCSYPAKKMNVLDDYILGFLLNDKLDVTKKIIQQSVSLSEAGVINATSTAKESDEFASFIVESQTRGYKLVNTGTIDPFSVLWGSSKLTKQGKKFLYPSFDLNQVGISENRLRLYSSPKIIVSKIGLSCESFYDSKGEFASIDTNCIHSFKDDFKPEYILCWLNSKLYNYMFECLFDGLRMSGGYLLFSSPNLKSTYIKRLDEESQHIFVSLAESMQELNELLLQNRKKFLHRVMTSFDNLNMTSNLENFDKKNFKIFLTELKKQKINLTLAQQDEWEEYFNTCKSVCNEFSRKIDATDREINQKLYELYGLTDDEIVKVEESFKVS